jgi:hypothetical protein
VITQEDVMKVQEIAELHDEAFWHLHQYDGHAKSSDGYIGFDVSFGTVWDRKNGPVTPRVGVIIYSYVVSSETPLYPNFGDRNHYFESLDEALLVMKEWHKIAMAYNPTEEELAESDTLALQLWDAIESRTTIIDVEDDEESK